MKNAVFSKNRKASFDYEFLKTYEAGIVLRGHEVKAVQNNRISITGSQVRIKDGRAYLVGADIAPYQPENTPGDYNPLRDRELLLNKKELLELVSKTTTEKLTIVPISVYNKNYKIKLQFALARHKTKADKRSALRKKDDKRKMKRITG